MPHGLEGNPGSQHRGRYLCPRKYPRSWHGTAADPVNEKGGSTKERLPRAAASVAFALLQPACVVFDGPSCCFYRNGERV
jgi:hypothetical protein